MNDHAEVTKFLLEKGADINAKANMDGWIMPIHMAATVGAYDALNILLNFGVDVNSTVDGELLFSDQTFYMS